MSPPSSKAISRQQFTPPPPVPAVKAVRAPKAVAALPLATCLGLNVRLRRRALGLSQRDLAEASGISQKYIARVETHSANVTLDIVEGLAKHLGCNAIELLSPPPR
jgi:ribosome-binding protein aMBF1 (putative translation factor)